MKLKGLLKGLCIFGLTLLPISFSNADWNSVSCVEYDSNSTNVVYGNTILTFNNGNFATQRGSESIQNVMWLTRPEFNPSSSTQGYWLSSAFGYINGKPYLYAGSYSDTTQGYPQDVCVESLDTFDLSTFGSNRNCSKVSISNFLVNKNIVGGGYCYPDSTNNYAYAPFTYCFYDSTNAYCFKIASYNYSPHLILTYTGSIGLSTPLTPTKLLNVEWSPSPFTSSNNNSSIVNPRDSAQNIYDAYRSKGYSDTLCYVGFGLDNIISTGNSSFYDIQVGKGATIFELYNYYSGGFNDSTPLSFVDWYNDWDFQYGFFNDYHDLESEYQYYIGKPKGFVGAFMIKDFYFKGSNFDTATLKSFCEFSLANDTLIDKNKTPIDVISDTINENEINKLIGNIGIILPGSGSALDLVAGTLSGYQEQDFWSIVQSGYNVIDGLKYDTSGYPGILPTYIVVGFLLIFLVYVFKH